MWRRIRSLRRSASRPSSRGLERYHFAEREVGVAPGEVLMVPPGLTYGSSIRSSEPTDSFSVYFPNRWIEAHLNHIRVDHVRRLLDAGCSYVSLPLAPEIGAVIRDCATALARAASDSLTAQEVLARLAHRVFGLAETADDLAGRINATSLATRLELLRRTSRVRDLLETRIESGASLAELAREACLSEFHLLRVFKQVFGATPARYLEARRMERARTLLLETELPVAEVAAACGYGNLSAFGRAFRRAWGTSATGVRETRRDVQRSARQSVPRRLPTH